MKPQTSSGFKNEWHFTVTVPICLVGLHRDSVINFNITA